jgi:hypothetical protein
MKRVDSSRSIPRHVLKKGVQAVRMTSDILLAMRLMSYVQPIDVVGQFVIDSGDLLLDSSSILVDMRRLSISIDTVLHVYGILVHVNAVDFAIGIQQVIGCMTLMYAAFTRLARMSNKLPRRRCSSPEEDQITSRGS